MRLAAEGEHAPAAGAGCAPIRLPEPFVPAQQPAHAREEDRQLERLGQVVVGARARSRCSTSSERAARGQHQHGHELADAPQLGHDREAVDARAA